MNEAQLNENKKENKEEKKTTLMQEITYWVGIVIIAIVFAQLMKNFVIINAVVPSSSMEDTIQIDNRLIGGRFSYWFSEPKRGDIVIFKYPVNEERTFIKRVIGLPGEHIEIRDGRVYIDGSDEPLDEDYLKEEWTVMNSGLEYDVPEDCYFMLGDNRNNSADSRYWAEEAIDAGIANEQTSDGYTFVNEKKILGKALFIYYDHLQML